MENQKQPLTLEQVAQLNLEQATEIARGTARAMIARARRNEPRPDKRNPGMIKSSVNETMLENLFVGSLTSVVAEGRKAERRRILGLLAGLSNMWRNVFKTKEDIEEKARLLADVRADALEIVIAAITAGSMPQEAAIPIGPMEAREILRRAQGDRVQISAELRQELRIQLGRQASTSDFATLLLTGEHAAALLAALRELDEPVPSGLAPGLAAEVLPAPSPALPPGPAEEKPGWEDAEPGDDEVNAAWGRL